MSQPVVWALSRQKLFGLFVSGFEACVESLNDFGGDVEGRVEVNAGFAEEDSVVTSCGVISPHVVVYRIGEACADSEFAVGKALLLSVEVSVSLLAFCLEALYVGFHRSLRQIDVVLLLLADVVCHVLELALL